MTVRRCLANLLAVGGLAAVDIWIWSHAVPALYEATEDRTLDQQMLEARSRPTPPPAPEVHADSRPRRGSLVGRLSIPRLGLHAIVREGDGEKTLSLALGHIPSTALPGQSGNVGVAGHRDTIFRALRWIRKDDLIVIETVAGRYAYRVEGMEIVKPKQVSVLDPGRLPELTLVTCYPFHYVGSAPNRFIVRARQVVERASTRPQGRRKAGRA